MGVIVDQRKRAEPDHERGREASLTSALNLNDCGCFVPDLTRFTAGPCEGARQRQFYQI